MATEPVRVAVIVGSTREGRFAPTVARWVTTALSPRGRSPVMPIVRVPGNPAVEVTTNDCPASPARKVTTSAEVIAGARCPASVAAPGARPGAEAVSVCVPAVPSVTWTVLLPRSPAPIVRSAG